MTRKEAKSLGLKRYSNGSPCPKNHISERYVSNGTCAKCTKPTMIEFICLQCGILFVARKREKSRNQKFCSKKCYGISIAIIKTCLNCGGEFYNWQNDKYCSMKCSGESRRGVSLSEKHKKALRGVRIQTRGEKNHRWKGGCNDRLRGRHEYRKWREEVYEADNYSCRDCGKRSSKGESVYLEAHHIKHWAKYPAHRFEVSNGVTLCKECHTERHKRERMNEVA